MNDTCKELERFQFDEQCKLMPVLEYTKYVDKGCETPAKFMRESIELQCII